jgi:hypothetical protein
LPIVFMVALSRGVGLEQVNRFLPGIGLDVTLTQRMFHLFEQSVYAAVIIDLGMSLFTKRRESLHDLLSRTSVFREQRVKRRKRKPKRHQKLSRPKGPPPALQDLPAPALSTLASLFVPGLGQLLNGQGSKGLVFFIGLVIAFAMSNNDYWFPLIVWGLNIYDANRTAHRRIAQLQRNPSARNQFSDI